MSAATRRIPAAREPPTALGAVFDLMATLNESVSRAKAPRAENGPADVHELLKAPKKPAARKGLSVVFGKETSLRL